MIRPLREEDVPALHLLMCETFEHYARTRGLPVRPRPDPAIAYIRPRHLIRTDPDGAWGAEHDGRLVAVGLALKRERVWGLSLLVTHPDHQSSGVGRAVLDACHDYAHDARGRIILSSSDPRALRAYARLGLHVHPTLTASGRGLVSEPPGIREGAAADIPFTEVVDRHVRGAAHGPDIQALLDMGQTLLVSDGGYTVFGADGELRILAAYDEAAATDLLRAALARLDHVTVMWMTERQQWAIRACVDARLELKPGEGAVFVSGDVGPFRPYIPHGAFL